MPAKTLQIPTTDGQADAFAAFPGDGERHPGVLLYSDAFGLRPVLREMARELAGHGYYVLVPNIYYRHGPAPVTELPGHIGEEIRPAVIAKLMPLIEAHSTEQILRDADAYLKFLAAQPEVSAGPAAVIGYCLGAALAMRTAAAHPGQVAAVAGFHPGFLVTSAPDSPHRLIPKITAQVHLGLAENDMKPEAISELNQALDAAGVAYTTEIYPGTIHGYTMSDTDAFNPAALQRHWDRLLPLLDRSLATRLGLFKRFALALYQRPGVADACLDLQNRHELDVNVVLFAAFVGSTGQTLTTADLDLAHRQVDAWHQQVVRPLRAVRQRLKTGPVPAPSQATGNLRRRLAQLEIEAEMIELDQLATLVPQADAPGSTGSTAECAATAVETAVTAHTGTPPGDEDRAAIATIAAEAHQIRQIDAHRPSQPPSTGSTTPET
jgi:carboxymethylenebutenolidase